MRVFVAGATGALGRPLTRLLVADGHDVTGLTRSDGKRALLSDLGATPAVGDALDAGRLGELVVEARPDVVVHALTALPPMGPRRFRDLEPTNRLRTEGTANLLAAALAAGARRVVAESIVLIYGHVPSGEAREDNPWAHIEEGPLAPALRAIRSLEEQLRAAASGTGRTGAPDRIESVALRFGLFYGQGSGTDEIARLLRRRRLPLPPDRGGTVPWIHIRDAAAATAAAVTHPRPGPAYNIVGDDTASVNEFARRLARAAGAPPPRTVPLWLARLFAPYAVAGGGFRIAASNRLARQELGWTPTWPTLEAGLAADYVEEGQHVG